MVFFFFFFIYFFSFFSFLSYIIYDIIITFRGRLRRVRTSRPYYVAIPRPQRFYRYKTMSSNIIQCQTRLTRSFSTRNRLFPPTFLRVPKKFPVEQCEKTPKFNEYYSMVQSRLNKYQHDDDDDSEVCGNQSHPDISASVTSVTGTNVASFASCVEEKREFTGPCARARINYNE